MGDDSGEDYVSEEDSQRPKTRDIGAAMADARLFSASQTRRAQVKVRGRICCCH